MPRARNPFTTSHGYRAIPIDVEAEPDLRPHLLWRSWCYEHIAVKVRQLGRPLRDGELVHHRNGDKLDNGPRNLKLTTRSEHSRGHAKTRARDRSGRFRKAA